jgi:hypothetical protein
MIVLNYIFMELLIIVLVLEIFLVLLIIDNMEQIMWCHYYIIIYLLCIVQLLLKIGLILYICKLIIVGRKIKILRCCVILVYWFIMVGSKMFNYILFLLVIHMKILTKCFQHGMFIIGNSDFSHY